MKTKVLLVLAALFMAMVPASAQTHRTLWQPSGGLDLFQPGYNLTGTSNQFHLTLVGGNVALFRVGKVRFPTVGLDFQARCTNCSDDYDKAWAGHWLLTSGIRYVISESSSNNPDFGDDIDLHVKALYSTRQDADLRVGRLGVGVGLCFAW